MQQDGDSYIQDDKVTGVSRSGRLRKKSSKLMDFESPDEVEAKMRRQRYIGLSSDPDLGLDFNEPKILEGILSESETEGEGMFDQEGPSGGALNSSLESYSSGSDDGTIKATPANSLYMMEKNKKKSIVRGEKSTPRAKAQRKDKGKTRITAYMMWAKEARNELLKYNPTLNFSSISKRLGEMWSNVNYNERYQWKRKAKRWCIEKDTGIQTKPTKRLITSIDIEKRSRRIVEPLQMCEMSHKSSLLDLSLALIGISQLSLALLVLCATIIKGFVDSEQ